MHVTLAEFVPLIPPGDTAAQIVGIAAATAMVVVGPLLALLPLRPSPHPQTIASRLLAAMAMHLAVAMVVIVLAVVIVPWEMHPADERRNRWIIAGWCIAGFLASLGIQAWTARRWVAHNTPPVPHTADDTSRP